MMKPAAALYHRVSTLDQDPTLARSELRRAARERGYRVPREYDIEERGSGARNDRPGLLRVLDAAHRGRIKAVFVWKLDRWGRSGLDVLTNVKALRDAGVRFVCVSQGISLGDKSDAAGTLLLSVMAAMAEFERDLLRERTHLGLTRARKRGIKLGRPYAQPTDLPAKVARLRRAKRSWSQIARALKRPQSTVRRAFAMVHKQNTRQHRARR